MMRAQAYKLNSRQGCTTVAVKMLKGEHESVDDISYNILTRILTSLYIAVFTQILTHNLNKMRNGYRLVAH